jgi:hypothetical protein
MSIQCIKLFFEQNKRKNELFDREELTTQCENPECRQKVTLCYGFYAKKIPRIEAQ